MPTCLLGIGSNLGDRAGQLNSAIDRLQHHPQIQDVRASRWMATLPIGGPSGQSEFLNGAITLQTSCSPFELLSLTQKIEQDLGRNRTVRWGARTLDIDILLYGDLCIDRPPLTIPHPWMSVRRFVLEPASEIAGSMHHPVIGWTIQQLYDHWRETPNRIAVVGIRSHAEWTTLTVRCTSDVQGEVTMIEPVGFALPVADVEARLEWFYAHADRLRIAGWTPTRRVPRRRDPKAVGGSDSGGPVWVSGFWMPQLEFQTLEGIDFAQRRQHQTVRTPAVNELAPPKLVVTRNVARESDADAQRLANETRRLLHDRRECPALHLIDDGTDCWMDECVAAIAMLQDTS